MSVVYVIIFTGLAFVLGIPVGFFIRRKFVESKLEKVEEYSKKIISQAQKEADNIKKEAELKAKDLLYQMKMEFEKEAKEKKEQLLLQEKRLIHKEENIDKKIEQIERREEKIAEKEKEIDQIIKKLEEEKKQIEELKNEQKRQLETIAGMSKEEAKELLIKEMEEEARNEAAKLVRKIETDAKIEADKKAKEILALAIKKYAGESVAEQTVSVVHLPNEEMKGRIIGREGRNIRAIEAATGVDVIIDDTPEAVILSGFNPIRREVAKIALERLIYDGRIHPARIEEVVAKVTEEVEEAIKEAGERAAFDVGVHGIHPELIRLLGRLKYRSSYAQNVLQHSIEVSFICGIMASELGMDVKQAKRAGLLHDIGKAVDHEIEGPHALIGADLAKKYGESEEVVHAIAAHHEDVPPQSILAILVQAADTISGARPGARKEMLETYIKRLKNLEEIAMSFKGVAKAYAIQAGRELRVIVEGEMVSDDEAYMICKEIAKKIEKELTYPGQIKVTVIRETRAIEYAK
ncbi:MAG: ribonuclease Y [Deltaproteobacteria bacterium]|nr:MAG: ribonuclease Y [Deltaproteobacteria bacterium]